MPYDLSTPTRLTRDISTTEGTEPLGRRLERLERRGPGRRPDQPLEPSEVRAGPRGAAELARATPRSRPRRRAIPPRPPDGATPASAPARATQVILELRDRLASGVPEPRRGPWRSSLPSPASTSVHGSEPSSGCHGDASGNAFRRNTQVRPRPGSARSRGGRSSRRRRRRPRTADARSRVVGDPHSQERTASWTAAAEAVARLEHFRHERQHPRMPLPVA